MPLLLQCNDPGYVQDILWLAPGKPLDKASTLKITELLLPSPTSSTLSPFISKVRPNVKTFLKENLIFLTIFCCSLFTFLWTHSMRNSNTVKLSKAFKPKQFHLE
uniref:Uncharacterized protein n=1 Tax=Colobus angolensis palliatus TaxID=336983 RepID=A0A2K5HT72_COLAP